MDTHEEGHRDHASQHRWRHAGTRRAPFRGSERITDRRTTETPYVTSNDGTRIAYTRSGSGPNVIFVTGALGTKDSPFMLPFIRAFEPHFSVINYDRRGRGDSGDNKPFSVQKEIDDIQALIDAHGPSHLVGTSSGAALVLEAAMRGVPMLSAVAFEPPYMVGKHMTPALAAYENDVTALVAANRRSDAVKLFMRVVGVPGWMLAVMRILPMWKKMEAVAHTLPYDAAALSGFVPPVDRLASIRVPTLLVYGDKTPQSLQDGTKAVAKMVPDAELRLLPKQSHNLKAAAIVPTLVEFTGRHVGVASPRSTRPVTTARRPT